MGDRLLFVDVLRTHRDFRLFLCGDAMFFLCSNINVTLLGWLVLETTGSPLFLALVEAFRTLPMMLGIVIGVATDRGDRKKIMVFSSAFDALLFFALGMLILTGNINIYFIVAVTLLVGLVQTITQTVRSVFLVDLVSEQSLTTSVALSMLTQNSTSFIASALIAVLVNVIGVGFFYCLSATFMAVDAFLLLRIRTVSRGEAVAEESPIKELVEGLKYVKSDRNLTALQLIAAIANMFFFPQTIMMLPIFAQQTLRLDAAGYAWLRTALNTGMLIGTVSILLFGRAKHRGILALGASAMWGILLLLLSLQGMYFSSLLYLVAVGVANTISMQMVQVLLLTYSSRAMRGRVMGVRMQAIMFLSVGDLVWGYIANSTGIQATMGISNILSTVSLLALVGWAPSLRKLE